MRARGWLQHCRTPPHPIPLPQGEREPKNDLFIQLQTAVSRYCNRGSRSPSLTVRCQGVGVVQDDRPLRKRPAAFVFDEFIVVPAKGDHWLIGRGSDRI